MTKWADTVKDVFKKNRAINPSYMFKDALKDAKKVYRSGEKVVSDTVDTVGKKIRRNTQKKRRSTGKKRQGKTHHRRTHRRK